MAEITPSSQPIRFGLFELDLCACEVRKNGLKIALQDQPFQILARLLERPGELITREELRALLWPADTFVDFEDGLNTAIRKLRLALGDSADNPRFIQTAHRRGYRFIAPVTRGGTNLHPGLDSLAPSESMVVKPQASRVAPGYALVLPFAGLVFVGLLTFWFVTAPRDPKILGYAQITRDGQVKGGPLVTDGSRLYFMEIKSGVPLPVEVASVGGQAGPLPAPFEIWRIGDISAVRSELLVFTAVATEAEGPLWALPIPAGAPRRLGDLMGHEGAWSPDGQRIAYANGHALYIAGSDGTGSRKLVVLPGSPCCIRWSPDGTVIRFSVGDPKTPLWSVWEVSPAGSNPRRVFPNSGDSISNTWGGWTPDGRYYVYSLERNGRSDLWALREKKRAFERGRDGPTPLTSGPLDFTAPSFSRDGKKLFVLGASKHGELVRFDSVSRQFLPYLPGISADGLAFSRDGQWVVYTRFPERTLWRSKADGSQPVQLTSAPMQVLLPRLSPDGKRVAFMGQLPGGPWKIYLVSPSGGGLEQVPTGDLNQGNPSWSPDGSSLAFAGVPWVEAFERGSTAIRVVDLRTRQVTTLPGSEGLWSPRWSPDGRYIAAIPLNSQKLVLFDFMARKWSELANVSVAYTSWSHDGKYVYASTFSANDPAIYRVRISDSRLEPVVSLKGQRQAWTLGPWFGLAPDDSPLVLREAGSQEIYALDFQAP